ncbi:caspase-8-like [Gadus chalcogrammus]|uniref:caspase-8-like n=1 Tax=Gadus chalcogrammus TaxID=1042646 RepID=UPI0024C4D71F|nr:caspase-8-like [Gadus chalcogrammus]XP_056452687.1 caspase-8-like [Gadus chalcogrammus]XP_056452688.1 caspase-8-like [Gadus chalcogrammus]
MAHNAIVRNKTIIQDILSADAQFILNKVREKTLITDREYKKLKTINKGDAEDLVIQLVDTLNNKGRQSEFIEVLQDEIVLETYPKLKDVEWGVSGSTAVSSSSLKRSSGRSLNEDAPESHKSQKTENKYPITSKPTGLCVIINNENFHDKTKRSGTEKDAESLADVFSWLGFKVLMCKDQTASDMAQVTKLLADPEDLAALKKCKLEEWSDGGFTSLRGLPQHGDAFVCCVLSHGKENAISGVDFKQLAISDITSAFNGKHCPALLGKPKVFFIQACQGHNLQPGLAVDDYIYPMPIKEDSPNHPMEADFLVSKATVGKYQALRDRITGSIFIQSLCEQLRKGCNSGEDILEILVHVNADISKKDFGKTNDPEKVWKQMPEFGNVTLTSKLVFSPCSS